MPKVAKGKAKTEVSSVATPMESVKVQPVVEENGKKVKFPKLKISECSTVADVGDNGRPPFTPDEWKEVLGWKSETDYIAEMIQKEPGSKPEKWAYGEDYHCKNTKDDKVRCLNNPNNRPFDMTWCKQLKFTILKGLWAGPYTVPGETVNGETVRIGKYGNVLSGQHQGTAVILADEELKLDRLREDYTLENDKFPFWRGQEYPFIETIVVYGLSEDERVLRTIDYVKPRTAADMLYTMPLFRDNTPPERKEMTKMLSAAVDVLWERTKALGYKTHPEIVGFLERHEMLLQMIEHIFIENSAKGADGGRKISKLHLSPGACAAIGYLMACSNVEDDEGEYGEAYRDGKPPSEKLLDFSMWDKAIDFWTRMAGAKSFEPVRHMLQDRLPNSRPTDFPDGPNVGNGGRTEEKLTVLSKAWEVWCEHDTSDRENEEPAFIKVKNPDGSTSFPDLEKGGALHLYYSNLTPVTTKMVGKGEDRRSELTGGEVMPNGAIRLIDVDDFGGIDYFDKGKKKEPDEVEPEAPSLSQEEIEAAAESERQRAEEEGLARKKKEEEAALERRKEHHRKLLEQRAAAKLKGGTE